MEGNLPLLPGKPPAAPTPEKPPTIQDIIKLLTEAIALLSAINDSKQSDNKQKNIIALQVILTEISEKLGKMTAATTVKGGSTKGKGKAKGKKKGGADVNLATQGSQLMNTENLLQNPMNSIHVTQPWAGPMPTMAGLSFPSDLTAGLPGAGVLDAMDPKITTGGKGASKKTKKTTNSKKK